MKNDFWEKKKLINSIVKKMNEKGVQLFYNFTYCGGMILDAECLPQLLKDEREFWKKYWGVTEKQYQKYEKYIKHQGQCQALTIKGKKCKNKIDQIPVYPNTNFDERYLHFCKTHQ